MPETSSRTIVSESESHAPINVGNASELSPTVVNEGPVKKEDVPSGLPIDKYKNEIEAGILAHDTFFLMGHTGSGKSTAGPEYVFNAVAKEKASPRIIVTQPRRIAVEDVAKRLRERLERRGDANMVGFRHGAANTANDQTKITVMADASLLNELGRDPMLTNYDAVVIDEAHEENNDMLLNFGFLKRAQRARKQAGLKPLKVVIATATFDREKHRQFHGEAGEIEVEGKMFHVEEHFLEDEDFGGNAQTKQKVLSGITLTPEGDIDVQDLPVAAGRLAAEIINDTTDKRGDVVTILPGRAEIEEAVEEFKKNNSEYECVVLIGGDDEKGNYEKIHHKDKKPIAFFSTSLVEASVTIDNATKVIDAGLSRGMYYDPETGLTSLRTVPHAQSNYVQRKGRAGRVHPGDSYALFTNESLKKRDKHMPAEIMRTDLAALTLRLKSMGVDDVDHFDFLDHPGKERLDQAIQTLYQLGALDKDGHITPDGRGMAKLPIDPHYSRMLVEAKKLGCAEQVSVLVGFLSSRNGVFFPPGRGETLQTKYGEFIVPGSDYLTLLKVWNAFVVQGKDKEKSKQWALEENIRRGAILDALRTKSDLSRDESLREVGVTRANREVDLTNPDAIISCVLAGLTDKVLIEEGGAYKLADGKKSGILLGNTSALAVGSRPPYMVSGGIRSPEKTERTYAGLNQVISKEMYEELMERMKHTPEMMKAEEKLEEEAREEEDKPLATATEAHTSTDQTTPIVKEESPSRVSEEQVKKKTAIQQVKAFVVSFMKGVTAPFRITWQAIRKLLRGK